MPEDVMWQIFGGLFKSPVFWGVILLVVVSGIFSVYLPRIKGRIGESRVNSTIVRGLDRGVYHLIPDIYLPAGEGTTQVDHVVVSRYGVFVIETKNYSGWIFGKEKDKQWTQSLNKHTKNRFQNPLRQNYKHTKTLAELTGIPEELLVSMVVFVGDATIKTEMPANVMYVRDLVKFIEGHDEVVIQDGQVLEIVDTISAWTKTVSEKQRKGHAARLKGRTEARKAGTE
tara:strand:+ start:259 stop:942 length:684 start_codon:yes stop_codon:yes gene_type:complete